MPHDRASLVLDAAADAYVDVLADLQCNLVVALARCQLDEAVTTLVKQAMRQVAVTMLEATLDFEDRPAFMQFDERIADLLPPRLVAVD